MRKNTKNIYGVNQYNKFSDFQFSVILMDIVGRYFKLKKSCEVAKRLLIENCHDFYFSLDMSEIISDYNDVLKAASERNISVNYSISDFECSVDDVAQVLNNMCMLELSWLDENRIIFDQDDVDAFYVEESNTLEFYKGLISSLSKEQISFVENSIDDVYMLTL